MARLFITERVLNFISDITKEIVKDVIGQKIYYYPISELKTKTHDVYNEALKKVYDNPIEIECIVDANFQQSTKIDKFGIDKQFMIEAFIQYRDLVDKGIRVNIGDFFSFDEIFYEVTEAMVSKNIFGLPEHKNGIKIIGNKSRDGLFKAPLKGPTDIANTDADAVQTEFEQQRGNELDSKGNPTADKRDLRENGTLDPPIDGPRKIIKSFYDE